MAFKLGKARQPLASGGVVNKKLSFKSDDASVSGNPVVRKKLDQGILGEANMDGSIYISDQIQPGSQEERQVLLHEMRHATDMKLGKLAYNDDSVYYDGITYPRETINGKDMIKVDGKWKEAGDDFPWEKTASI
jgi:hypothetical protein|tara:strand:+ start:298 stop:699 length:402 start_codon:yes stop_codon:yes gene_type:complete